MLSRHVISVEWKRLVGFCRDLQGLPYILSRLQMLEARRKAECMEQCGGRYDPAYVFEPAQVAHPAIWAVQRMSSRPQDPCIDGAELEQNLCSQD